VAAEVGAAAEPAAAVGAEPAAVGLAAERVELVAVAVAVVAELLASIIPMPVHPVCLTITRSRAYFRFKGAIRSGLVGAGPASALLICSLNARVIALGMRGICASLTSIGE
jgi:hypothetical protein